MPTYGLHVPDDWEFKKAFDSALSPYKGKPSPFIRYAVEASLRKDSVAPDALASTVLVDLTRRLCGELDARALERHLYQKKTYDQPRVLPALLVAGQALSRGAVKRREVLEKAPKV